jgi:hypothetical protein
VTFRRKNGDDTFPAEGIFEALRSQVTEVFTLDGQPLATVQTATKRLLRDLTEFGLTTGYWFQQGRVLAPDELAVGTHTLTLLLSDPFGVDLSQISFTVDAAGTGACL